MSVRFRFGVQQRQTDLGDGMMKLMNGATQRFWALMMGWARKVVAPLRSPRESKARGLRSCENGAPWALHVLPCVAGYKTARVYLYMGLYLQSRPDRYSYVLCKFDDWTGPPKTPGVL